MYVPFPVFIPYQVIGGAAEPAAPPGPAVPPPALDPGAAALPPVREAQCAPARPPLNHRNFRPLDDARLERVMEGRLRDVGPIDWAEIAREMDRGFTARQVMDRWFFYLGPGINRGEFSLAERRQCLKESVGSYGDWGRIAAKIGNGTQRTAAQVKGVVVAMHNKLNKLQIALREPADVDALPDCFFEKRISREKAQEVCDCFRREHEARAIH
jgi:hypothetical protein